jgi:DNA-binding transcriptional LysR family regulator
MNIRQLETFYWIAQLGTFSAAAERLHTSQANVSARIRELEEELNVLLFDRIGRQVQLTVKARELLVHAEKVVHEAARLQLAAGKPDMVRGVIKIGLGEAIAMRSLVALINELKRRYDDIEVEFDIDLNAHLVRKLLRGAIDIGLFGGPVEVPELAFVPIGAMPITWVGAPSLFAGQAVVSQEDIAALPIISLPREARLYTLLQEWFTEAAVAPKRMSFCNNLTTMLHVARAGLSVCMVPTALVEADVQAGTLQAPTAVPPLRSLKFFVVTRLESVDPAITEIASIVADVARLPDSNHIVARAARGTMTRKGRGIR